MRSVSFILTAALVLAAGACSDDTTNSLGSDNGDAGSAGHGSPASGGSDQGGGSTIVDETGGSAGSGTGGVLATGGMGTGGDPGSGGTGTGGDPGTGGDLGSGGTGTGGDPGSGGTGTGGADTGGTAGDVGSGGTGIGGADTGGTAGDVGTGGTAAGGDAGSADAGVGGAGTGGTGTGGTGVGGSGGVECPPLPSCNWCGGEDLIDANGCITGWVCANGIDPCENPVGPCFDVADCEADEVCEDELCWPDTPTRVNTAYFDWVANPCTTDPCLPGLVGALVDPSTDVIHIIVDDGGWVTESTWDGFDGFIPMDGQPVLADGRVSYHTDINGQVYLEIEITSLFGRTG